MKSRQDKTGECTSGDACKYVHTTGLRKQYIEGLMSMWDDGSTSSVWHSTQTLPFLAFVQRKLASGAVNLLAVLHASRYLGRLRDLSSLAYWKPGAYCARLPKNHQKTPLLAPTPYQSWPAPETTRLVKLPVDTLLIFHFTSTYEPYPSRSWSEKRRNGDVIFNMIISHVQIQYISTHNR